MKLAKLFLQTPLEKSTSKLSKIDPLRLKQVGQATYMIDYIQQMEIKLFPLVREDVPLNARGLWVHVRPHGTCYVRFLDYECYVDLISMLQMTEKQAYFWHVATISFHT